MSRTLADLRPVSVVGVGLHRYQRPSDTPYTALGVHAVREALADAGLAWQQIESAYTGTATTATGMSRLMYRHLGASGIPMAQVENASASGSTAFRQACIEVASGLVDVAIAVGVDKPLGANMPQRAAGLRDLGGNRIAPFTHFALLANRYIHDNGATPEQFAQVAVKNSRNGALNPNAQRQKERTLEEVLAPPQISGPLTRLQCCPVGEGAAAAIVASDEAIARLGLDRSRAVSVLSSAARSETVYKDENFDAALTKITTGAALSDAGVTPDQLDVVELHDAFTVEELLYIEAMGIAEAGTAAAQLAEGQFDIGGRVAVSSSGGLLSMGHPIGPTGVGQICEITTQLRGEAGERQHHGASIGLAHMVGVGAVCVVHVLGTVP
ncbi:MAG: thiolase family protein [Pseudomonadales bacterium]|jgi:acetyl-CoA acetyltransferase|nr:thiolase family protein [Pseudomonadales bacterium]MDP6469714.1 thiolase family protein [Pseudomonadales bacterium]MDP6827685.1 thiolase family protein [Pseudomonadales bacterium]MDP6971875.1 thiolase family protein [Pseudomonadales bacterium]